MNTPTSLEHARAALEANTRARRAIERAPSAGALLLGTRFRRTRGFSRRIGLGVLALSVSHPRGALLAFGVVLAAIF